MEPQRLENQRRHARNEEDRAEYQGHIGNVLLPDLVEDAEEVLTQDLMDVVVRVTTAEQ